MIFNTSVFLGSWLEALNIDSLQVCKPNARLLLYHFKYKIFSCLGLTSRVGMK